MSFILLGILNSQVTATAAGSYDLLETTLISTNTASVTFSNLNNYSDYKHLQLRVTARRSVANTGFAWNSFQFNSDTGSNYTRHALNGDGSAVASSGSTAEDRVYIIDSVAEGSATANVFGVAVIDILDFGNTSKNATVRYLCGGHDTAEKQIVLGSAAWLNTNAITTITFQMTSGNYVSGSRFSLYGIK